MGLEIALSNALTGLMANQAELQVTSNNVSNANTPGYTRKTAAQTSVVLGTQGAGVQTLPITRSISQGLVNAVNTQAAAQAFSQALSDILGQFEDANGNPSSATSVANQIASLASQFQALATSPSSSVSKIQLVSTAQQFTNGLNSLVQTIQSLRTNADQQISQAVSAAQQQLQTIAQMNQQIAQAQAAGQPTAELQDQRDLAVSQLSAEMNVTTFQHPDGTIAVYTTTGQLLLDGTSPAPTLTHNQVGSSSPSLVYPGGYDGIKLNGTDITTAITGGKIGALIQLRDTTLPNINKQLDALATAAANQINAIHNTGSSAPAPNSLTGQTPTATTNPFSGTGTVRIAVIDQKGNAAATPLDLNLATVTPATVAGLLSAINTGLAGVATASVTNGQLVITATNPQDGIAINQENTNVNGSGQGFSSFFGLNDFFVLGASGSPAQTIAVRSDIVANPNFVATGTLSTAALTTGQIAVASGDNSVVQAMANAFQTATAIPAAGGLAATTATLADYGGQIIANAANQAATASSDATFQQTLLTNLSNQAAAVSGVNTDQELTNLTVYQNAYAASARVVTVVNQMFQILEQMGQ
ncbi:MAG TPA: flagellar hook-associated protein FlgK [Alphaproteobacteria bacterium]|nr:flagellar hook-associated protein FlgK [Alphaproteobacteria bacterium]